MWSTLEEAASDGFGGPGPRAAHSADLVGTKLFVFAGWNGRCALNDLYVLDTETFQWSQMTPSGVHPPPRNNHASVIVPSLRHAATHQIFLHGGHDGNTWLNDLHVLDTEEGAWVQPMVSGELPPSRACHTIARVGTPPRLVLFGGYNGSHCFDHVDVLDLDKVALEWRQPVISGPTPGARNAHTMTAVGSNLFLFGGHSGTKHLRDLVILNTAEWCWSYPSVSGICPLGLRGHTAVLIGRSIFVFGGYDGRGRSNDLYVLDTEDLSWSHPRGSEATPTGRQRHSATALGQSKMLIFGGFDGHKWLSDVYCLDVSSLRYEQLTMATEQSLLQRMRMLLNAPDRYCDITFIVEDRPIHAHKAILAAQCDQFAAMFGSGMVESRANEIRMHDWTYGAFQGLLEFLYVGTVEDLSAELAIDLMGLADHFTLIALKRLCENILVHYVDVDNVCAMLRRAQQYSAAELKRVCLLFVVEHSVQVSATPAFEALQEEPQLLLEVMRTLMSKS